VTWGDVGGLEDVKQAILDTIELPLKHRWGWLDTQRSHNHCRNFVFVTPPDGVCMACR
jgi:SpoVK/Ycf46/Vps4 family AAA+-type ATPase